MTWIRIPDYEARIEAELAPYPTAKLYFDVIRANLEAIKDRDSLATEFNAVRRDTGQGEKLLVLTLAPPSELPSFKQINHFIIAVQIFDLEELAVCRVKVIRA